VSRPRPAAPVADDDEGLHDLDEPYPDHDDGVTVIGPTEHLPASPSGADSGGAPPQGERERLIWAMEQCGWVQAKAARLLRVTPRQLGYALQKNRIEVRKF
jgi:Nif-specific regulatory protein